MSDHDCIHYCGRYTAPDGSLYVRCSAVDGDKPIEECNGCCTDHEHEEGQEDET